MRLLMLLIVAAAVIGGVGPQAYLTVGAVESGLTQATANQEIWQELNPTHAPAARAGHTMVNVNSQIFLFGGQGVSSGLSQQDGIVHNDLWQWDDDKDWWEEIAASPSLPARTHHATAVVGDKM